MKLTRVSVLWWLWLLVFGGWAAPVHALGPENFPPVDSREWTTQYDPLFRKYSKRFFGPGVDWRWFKSQGVAESNLNPNAKSWVNAKGLMQIMPETFKEIQKKQRDFVNIHHPRWNIAAGIWYDRWIFELLDDSWPLNQRLYQTFAAYNGGIGNLRKAQKMARALGKDEATWRDLEQTGPLVRTWRHEETIGYVRKIKALMQLE